MWEGGDGKDSLPASFGAGNLPPLDTRDLGPSPKVVLNRRATGDLLKELPDLPQYEQPFLLCCRNNVGSNRAKGPRAQHSYANSRSQTSVSRADGVVYLFTSLSRDWSQHGVSSGANTQIILDLS